MSPVFFQVDEMTGRLQQAEQANLIAQMALQPLSHPVSATAAANKQPVEVPLPKCMRTDAVKDLVDSSDEEEQNPSCLSKEECEASSQSSGEEEQRPSSDISGKEEQKPSSAGRGSAAASSGKDTEQHPTGCNSSHSQPVPVSKKHTDREEGSSLAPRMNDMQKTLERLAETLSQDVLKLQKALDGQSESGHQNGDHASPWGFAKPDVGASPGPSRPATAAQCGSSHRPNRQWSAGNAKPEAMHPADQHISRSGRARPSTAHEGDQHFQHVDQSCYSFSGQAPVRQSKRHMEDSWRDPVPPSRMPEDILRQAREDYMREKNRVRDKRLQELAARQGSVASTSS